MPTRPTVERLCLEFDGSLTDGNDRVVGPSIEAEEVVKHCFPRPRWVEQMVESYERKRQVDLVRSRYFRRESKDGRGGVTTVYCRSLSVSRTARQGTYWMSVRWS